MVSAPRTIGEEGLARPARPGTDPSETCSGEKSLAMTKKRVVIADDHGLIQQAIGRCLDDTNDFELVGSADTGAQVVPLVARTSPDLVLLDLNLPVLDGMDCLALLRETFPQVAVVIFSGVDDRETIERALTAGARAFVAKSTDPSDIPSAFRLALDGSAYYSLPPVVDGLGIASRRESEQEQERERAGLTAREEEILTAVARGLSNRAVGKELFLSDQTVKFHLHNIYGKLRVANRTEAAAAAHRLGLGVDAVAAA
jgi:DNA-binding NarL/FixJ family response regulator